MYVQKGNNKGGGCASRSTPSQLSSLSKCIERLKYRASSVRSVDSRWFAPRKNRKRSATQPESDLCIEKPFTCSQFPFVPFEIVRLSVFVAPCAHANYRDHCIDLSVQQQKAGRFAVCFVNVISCSFVIVAESIWNSFFVSHATVTICYTGCDLVLFLGKRFFVTVSPWVIVSEPPDNLLQ